MRAFHNRVDAADEILGADRNQDSRYNQDARRCNGTHDGFLGLVCLLVIAALRLGVEEVRVGPQLEPQI
jgi:hypothetical protein